MTSTHTNPATTDLQHIADNWPLLRELLAARTPATWPPAGRMADHQRDLDEANDADPIEQLNQLAALEWAERSDIAPGQRPVPLRVAVFDLLADLDAALLALADEIASAIQRPAFNTQFRSASPNDDVARSLALMGLKDQQDGRRWRFNMADRNGGTAAAWLADRMTTTGGPFAPMSIEQSARIDRVAAQARGRLDRVLGADGPTRTPLGQTCGCGGQLEMLTGPAAPVIRCTRCPEYAAFPGAVA
ncbi:hypothetical protein [Kitasatospora fiedleri]|uniref:hypothetical protein n=1 Tax=Kitasatospora fiedleri TaxID=2991545 RepID=UPI00249A5C6B|nr:hypothetical protein [Kitasatospora fiedleri]